MNNTPMINEILKWKPNPWIVSRRTNDKNETQTFIMEGFKQIAEVNSIEDIFSKGELASLLRSAPELHQKLKECVQLITSECVLDSKTISFLKECTDLIKRIEK